MRPIDADLAKEKIVSHANEFSDVLNRREKALLIGGGTSCIDKCPTIEAEPVKHGRWKGEGMGEYSCSLCTEVVWGNEYNYCPNCGAKMQGGKDE